MAITAVGSEGFWGRGPPRTSSFATSSGRGATRLRATSVKYREPRSAASESSLSILGSSHSLDIGNSVFKANAEQARRAPDSGGESPRVKLANGTPTASMRRQQQLAKLRDFG